MLLKVGRALELEVRSWFVFVKIGRRSVYIAPRTGLSCYE
jgi:hypothetical protein